MRTAHKAALAAAGLVVSLCVPTAQATAAGPVRSAAPAHALDRYYDQRPVWQRCGTGPQFPAALRCATVTVPLDYTRPAAPPCA